jgi:hypothetical protein
MRRGKAFWLDRAVSFSPFFRRPRRSAALVTRRLSPWEQPFSAATKLRYRHPANDDWRRHRQPRDAVQNRREPVPRDGPLGHLESHRPVPLPGGCASAASNHSAPTCYNPAMCKTNKRLRLALALWTLAWLIPAGAVLGYVVYHNNALIAKQMEQSKKRADEFRAAWLRKNSNDAPHP